MFPNSTTLKLMFVSLVLSFWGSVAFGQIGESPFGIKAGVNSATWSGDSDEYTRTWIHANVDVLAADSEIYNSNNRRFGFMIGAFTHYDLFGRFSIEPEVKYIQKGYHSKVKSGPDIQSQTHFADLIITLDYIEVPVHLRYDINPQHHTTYFVTAGPAIAFNVGEQIDFRGANGSSVSQDMEGVNTVDAGLRLGTGLQFGNLVLDAGYSMGLDKFHEDGSDFSLSNQSIMLSAGFLLNQ